MKIVFLFVFCLAPLVLWAWLSFLGRGRPSTSKKTLYTVFCVGEADLFVFLAMLLVWSMEGQNLTTFPYFVLGDGVVSDFLTIMFASEVAVSFVITIIATGWWLVKGIRLIKTKK